MTKVMIQRIKKIEDYRIFQGWTQSPEMEFARVNLIYGQNGSGKSTLASLFQQCSTGYPSSSLGLVLEVKSERKQFQATETDSGFWARIKVFNKEYIERNLAFNNEHGPQAQAILTIGESNIETKARLIELRALREELALKIRETKKQRDDTFNQLKNQLTRVANMVVADLERTPGGHYSGRRYNRRNLEKLLNGERSVLNSASTDLSSDRIKAVSSAMEAPRLPTRIRMAGEEALNTVRQLLNSDILVQVIDQLRDHPREAEWVQQGLLLHEGLDTCLFCDQPFTKDRRDQLAAHFDTSLTNLQERIDELIHDLSRSVESSKNYLTQLPTPDDVYPDLARELESARREYKKTHEDYEGTVDILIKALKKKRANPFSNPPIDTSLTLPLPPTTSSEAVVEKHRKLTQRHEEECAAAAQRVESHHALSFKDSYDQAHAEISKLEQDCTNMDSELSALQQRIIELENVEENPIPGADDLTAAVAGLLGRDELRFTTTSDGKHYRIERLGKPAVNLSEGEQTAIALLYFLVSVRENQVAGDEPIVIIDDPVSSLDNGILFGASAHLWAELVTRPYASQVFLMTHNFELFRQWLVQMESVPKAIRGTEGGYTAYEIRAAYEDNRRGNVARIPRLRPWHLNDGRTNKLRSQYHFLFSQVANGLLSADPGLGLAEQLEVMALMPNAARRMLESFLSFRCPHKMGSFHASMRAVLDGNPGLDQAVRTRVERYLHAYSHLEEADTLHPLDPSESTVVLRSLFQFMNHVDQEHVSSMCKALGIDEAALLKTPKSTPSLEDPHG